MPWVYLGVALNVVCVGGMLALVFCPEMTKRMVMAIFRWVKNLQVTKGRRPGRQKLDHAMDGYPRGFVIFSDAWSC